MSDQANTIEVGITASIRGLVQGLQGAGQAVREGATQMQSSLGGLSSAVSGLATPFVALTGLLAGGAIFKDAIAKTVEWTGDVVQLARALGVTTEYATGLVDALDDLGIDSDTATNAVFKLNMTLRSNEEALRLNGVATRDAKGEMLPLNTIFMNTIQRAKEMEAGFDRDQFMLLAFGRGAKELGGMLRLTNDQIAQSAQRMDELNMTVSAERVQQVRSYKLATKDAGDTLDSLQVTIGTAVLPALAELGRWFGDIGPGLAMVLGGALKLVTSGLLMIKAIIETVAIAAGAGFQGMLDSIQMLGRGVKAAMAGDWAEVGRLMEANAQRQRDIQQSAADGIKETWRNWRDDMERIFADQSGKGGAGAPVEDAGGGTSKFKPPKDKDKEDKEGERTFGAWKQQLQELRDLQQAFGSWSVDKEIEFWEAKFRATNEGSALQQKVYGELSKAYEKALQERHDATVEELRFQLEEARNNGAQRLTLQDQIIREEVRIHGKGSKEVIAAERERARIVREIAAEEMALRVQAANHARDIGLGRIANEEELLRIRRQMGNLSAEEETAAVLDFENRKHMLRQAALTQALQDETLNLEQRKALLNQKELLELEHYGKIRQIQMQAAAEQQETIAGFLEPLRSAFSSSLEGILSATMSWSQALRNIWRGVGQVIDRAITNMVMAWLTGEKTKTAATQMGVLQRLATEAWGAMKSVGLAIWTGLKWIAIKGYEAAAGAYSAISSIPYVGPFLAPAVAAGVLAAVIGMGSKIASASGGWDQVPSDQIAQLHKDEMVLPANIAERVRSMTDPGAGGQGGGDTYHFAASFMDARGAEDFLRRNQGPLVRVLKEAARNGRN